MTTENTDKGQTPAEADRRGRCAVAPGSALTFVDCAAFLRRPERKKPGTLIVMRPGITSQQVQDAAKEVGMAIRWATKEDTLGRGGDIFLVLGNAIDCANAKDQPLGGKKDNL